ncbi:MAG: hypothetical protein ACP5OG_04530 [Candidatus Nanoarchaeia archaeon]
MQKELNYPKEFFDNFYKDFIISCNLYKSMKLSQRSNFIIKLSLFFYQQYIDTLDDLHLNVSDTLYRKRSLLEVELDKRKNPSEYCCRIDFN